MDATKRRGSKLNDRLTPNRLGAMLRLYRTVHGRHLREVAQEIGTSPATLMRIEHGEAFDVTTWLKLEHWLLAKEE